LLKLTHMLYSIDHNISFTTNKTMTTEENLKRIGGGPFRDDILNELGIVHFQQGNRTEALSMWRQALLFNSASFRVHLNFAQTLFKGQDNITKLQLESDRQEALNTLKSLLGLRQQCEPHKQVGKKRKKAPLPAHCTHLLEHKKEFHNVLFDGYQLMGTIQSFYEKPFVAETYYKQALKMKPWDQQLHVLLAGVYENMGLFGQAKNYYKQCMKLGTSKGAGVLKATREAAEEDAAAAAEAAAAKGKSGGKQGKKNKKNNLFKKTQAQVVEDAYAQMKRERMGSVCGERMNKLEERMKKWVELKGDTYVNLKDGKR
jgi:tetratricopeptide (TPR) repeat protein